MTKVQEKISFINYLLTKGFDLFYRSVAWLARRRIDFFLFCHGLNLDQTGQEPVYLARRVSAQPDNIDSLLIIESDKSASAIWTHDTNCERNCDENKNGIDYIDMIYEGNDSNTVERITESELENISQGSKIYPADAVFYKWVSEI